MFSVYRSKLGRENFSENIIALLHTCVFGEVFFFFLLADTSECPLCAGGALCEQRGGLDITSLHSWFEGLVAQPEPIVLEHGPMI